MKASSVLGIVLSALVSQSAFAGVAEFAALCKRTDLPEQTKATVEALARFATGPFNSRKVDCDQAAKKLAGLKEVDLPGHTFHYYFVHDLSPIALIDHLESVDLGQQDGVKDLSPLASMKNLKHLGIAGTGIRDRDLEQLKHVPNIRSLSVSAGDNTPVWELLRLRNLNRLDLQVGSRDGSATRVDVSPLRSLYINALTIQGGYIGSSSNAEVAGIGTLANLGSLDVRGVNLNAKDIAGLQNLRSLIFQGGESSRISNTGALGQLTLLSSMTIVHAQLRDVGFLRTLKNLESLSLSSNEIADASPVSELIKLKSLDVSYNRIGADFAFANLFRLKSLNISGNQMGSLDLRPFRNLEILRSGGNHVSFMYFEGVYPQLKEIDLSNNNLRDVAQFKSSALPAIETLNLNDNRIFKIDSLGSLVTLKTLTIDDNRILDVSPLMTLQRIERLSARSNLLQNPVCPVKKADVCDFLHQGI